MKWRCAWCGKPHERNDPPCDNCGHGSFEKAVVPMAPEGEGGPTVWVCAECGREHPRNNPPCSRCGHMTLERREQRVEPGETVEPGGAGSGPGGLLGGIRRTLGRDTDEPREEPAEEPAGERTMTAWVCTECGREHPRNSPPCSRCGNMTFERRERRVGDIEPGGGGWLDALDPKFAVAFAVLVALAVVVALGAVGIVDLPGAARDLTVEDVPGSADTANGLELAAVEDAYVVEFNARREANGLDTLARNDRLDAIARYHNQRAVKAEYGDGSPLGRERVKELLAGPCDEEALVVSFDAPAELLDPAGDDSAEAVAHLLVLYYAESPGGEGLTSFEGTVTGVDVHVAPDGRVFVTQFVC